jgi:hypothetical protein
MAEIPFAALKENKCEGLLRLAADLRRGWAAKIRVDIMPV